MSAWDTRQITQSPQAQCLPSEGGFVKGRAGDKSPLHKRSATFALPSLPARRHSPYECRLGQRLQMLLAELRIHRGQILLHQI